MKHEYCLRITLVQWKILGPIRSMKEKGRVAYFDTPERLEELFKQINTYAKEKEIGQRLDHQKVRF